MNDDAKEAVATEAPASEREPVSAARELENVRRELSQAYDALEVAQRAITGILRRSSDRVRVNARNAERMEIGSCLRCGDEAQKDRTRCRDCGKRAAAHTSRRRATQRQGTDITGENA